jgi:2-haloacid dehalogenase
MPAWVLFDLNGTLLDPRPVGERLPVADGGALVLAVLHDAVVQAMADTLTGEYRPFAGYVAGALARQTRLAGLDLDERQLDAVARAMGRMPPFADSADALSILRDAGLRVGVLTNSARGGALDALEQAGLAFAVERVIASDAARAYKPAPVVYRTALAELGVAPADATLVSAHWWDVTGAKRAGMRTAWISAKERILLPGTPEPDVQAPDLRAAAQAIARQAAAERR